MNGSSDNACRVGMPQGDIPGWVPAYPPASAAELIGNVVQHRKDVYGLHGHQFPGGLSDDKVIFYGLRPSDGSCRVLAASSRMNAASTMLLEDAQAGGSGKWDDEMVLVVQMRASEMVAHLALLARIAADVVPEFRGKTAFSGDLDDEEGLVDDDAVLFVGCGQSGGKALFASDATSFARLGFEMRTLCKLFARVVLPKLRAALN